MELSVKYGDMEVKFTGSEDEVLRALLGFLSKVVPSFELVQGLTLTVDLENLLKQVMGIIAFAKEGVVITIPREKLGEREAILLNLVKAYVGYMLGKSERDSLSIAEILTFTGSKPGTAAARLSEMVDLGNVERVGRGEYRITTLGLKFFLEEALPKIKVV